MTPLIAYYHLAYLHIVARYWQQASVEFRRYPRYPNLLKGASHGHTDERPFYHGGPVARRLLVFRGASLRANP